MITIWWAIRKPTCRRPPRAPPRRLWSSRARDGRPMPKAICPRARGRLVTLPRSPNTWLHDVAPLEPLRARADPGHPAFRALGARHLSAAAPGALSHHFRLVAAHDLARARHPRHRLARRGTRASAGAAGGDPCQAPVGVGDDGVPGDLSAAGA